MKNSIETLKGYYYNCSKENSVFSHNGYFYGKDKENEIPGVNAIYVFKGKASIQNKNVQGKFLGAIEISIEDIEMIQEDNNEVKFVICDKTENSGKPYIAEDLSNTGDINSAWIFNTQEDAQKVIDNSNWDWAYTEKV